MSLYETLAESVDRWRQQGYACETYPAIAEILEWAAKPEGSGFRLRVPQVHALETYWYLRLVQETPHVFDLYRRLYSKTSDLLRALSIPSKAFERVDYNLDTLWKAVRGDASFVKEFKLDTLREAFTLAYPSYILALAMGAGKTALIGAIVATEFAMFDEYRDGNFVENALVFAPGKTIIESLRQLAEIPYERILPKRLYKRFASSLKLTFTRDGDPDIPVIRGSTYNLVVTNTEKIRIQKDSIRKTKELAGQALSPGLEENAKEDVANRRLQTIASLPNLAIFSDEAHHTYGNTLDRQLKKVRLTVDYLAQETKVVCVINTTGTPYHRRQPLRDVVFWYSLSEGIRDGILKEVAHNIRALALDDARTDQLVSYVVSDFFDDYGDVTLPSGAAAKLAIYFPQTVDLEELRPVVETTLMKKGYSPNVVLRNTSDSPQVEIDAFNRLNDPASSHRVILLVNKGTEGWDCPSLFACALARKLKSSNNFVLQAASRCLRQIPGNGLPARIYLSMDNREVLDRQLNETYGESLADLDDALAERKTARIVLRKPDVSPLVVKQVVRSVVRKESASASLKLSRPVAGDTDSLTSLVLGLTSVPGLGSVLRSEEEVSVEMVPVTMDVYTAAVNVASTYHLDVWPVYDELRRLYDGPDLPVRHLRDLALQIEDQMHDYTVHEEPIERAIALVRTDGFEHETMADGTVTYTAEIVYPVEREKLLLSWEVLGERNTRAMGFHYSPYDFDSQPERSFFVQLLDFLNLHADQVDDIYFTGALTDPSKTGFYVEYLGADDRWHRYTPDFLVRRRDGRCLIVEIKSAQFEAATQEDLRRHGEGQAAITTEGRKAVALKRWEHLDPQRVRYEIIYADSDELGYNQLRFVREFAEEG